MSDVVPCLSCLYGINCKPPVGVIYIFARQGCGIPTIDNQLMMLERKGGS